MLYDDMTFGQRLARRLSELDMQQKQLAEKININKAVISNYCLDKRQPDIKTMLLLADALDTSIEYLLTGKRTTSSKQITELAATLENPKLKDTYKILVELEPGNLDLAADQLDAILKKQKNDRK